MMSVVLDTVAHTEGDVRMYLLMSLVAIAQLYYQYLEPYMASFSSILSLSSCFRMRH